MARVSWVRWLRLPCGDDPGVRGNDPAATLAGNRLDAPRAGHNVADSNPDHSPAALQYRYAIDYLAHGPVRDFLGFSGSLRLCGRLQIGRRRGGLDRPR